MPFEKECLLIRSRCNYEVSHNHYSSLAQDRPFYPWFYRGRIDDGGAGTTFTPPFMLQRARERCLAAGGKIIT